MSNHHLIHIIPDRGSQVGVSLSLELIHTIPSQARTSYVKIPGVWIVQIEL